MWEVLFVVFYKIRSWWEAPSVVYYLSGSFWTADSAVFQFGVRSKWLGRSGGEKARRGSISLRVGGFRWLILRVLRVVF